MTTANDVRAIVEEASTGAEPAEALGPRLLGALLGFGEQGGLTSRQAAALGRAWLRFKETHPRFEAGLATQTREVLIRAEARVEAHSARTALEPSAALAPLPPAPPRCPERNADERAASEPARAPEGKREPEAIEDADLGALLSCLDELAERHGWRGYVSFPEEIGVVAAHGGKQANHEARRDLRGGTREPASRRRVCRLLGAPGDVPVPTSDVRLSTRWQAIDVCPPDPSNVVSISARAPTLHLLMPRDTGAPEWAESFRDELRALLRAFL